VVGRTRGCRRSRGRRRRASRKGVHTGEGKSTVALGGFLSKQSREQRGQMGAGGGGSDTGGAMRRERRRGGPARAARHRRRRATVGAAPTGFGETRGRWGVHARASQHSNGWQ
jgi:hypothetical protein